MCHWRPRRCLRRPCSHSWRAISLQLVIRSNEARRTYGYQVDADQAARQDVRSLQSLFAAITAGTPTSFTERLYAFSNRGPGNVEDRSGEPPNEPPPLTPPELRRGF